MRSALAGAIGVAVATGLLGCGSGGGGGGGSSGGGGAAQTRSPSLQVLPGTYDFGRVTPGNAAAPLEVSIQNTGNAPLAVSSIAFSSTSNPAYGLQLGGGTRPCGSASPTIEGGQTCTVRVTFQPNSSGTFTSALEIASNDARTPRFTLPISGTSESLGALTVRINQVDTVCAGGAAKAYVSVVDQGNFPLNGLGLSSFTVTQNAAARTVSSVTQGDPRPVALAAVVDNSGSISINQPVAYADMKNGFATLFNAMRPNDVGTLINFGTEYEVTVPFPSPSSPTNPTNKSALVAGLSVPWTKGSDTLLYDSVYKAIDDTRLQTAYRRAVVVATDGNDDRGGTGVPLSTRTLDQVISHATSSGVPVFAIGIGSTVQTAVLQQLASQTGGVFYRALTSQNLATIYSQLTSLLYSDQYVVSFDQAPIAAGATSPLRVSVLGPTGTSGSADRALTCP